MPTIRATDAAVTPDVLVIGLSKDPKSKELRIHSAGLKLNVSSLLDALGEMGATGAPDEVVKLPGETSKLIVTTGIGSSSSTEQFTEETLRRAAGAAARALIGQTAATFALPHKDSSGFNAIAEGALLGSYAFDEFRGSTKAERKKPLSKLEIFSKSVPAKDSKSILARAEIVARYTHLIRDLVNTPPSHLTPSSFSERFRPLAKKLGLNVEILNEVQLKKSGYGGIIGVGQGSAATASYLLSTKEFKAEIATPLCICWQRNHLRHRRPSA